MVTILERYQQVMDSFPEAVVVHDGRTILYMNREALRLAGASQPEQVVGRAVLSFVSQRFQGQVTERIAQVTGKGESTPRLLETLLRLDGTEIRVEVKTSPLRFGEVTAVQLVARECAQAEFHDLVASMQVGVIVHGPGAEILLSNAKALELLGLSEDQLLGKTSFDPSWSVVHDDGSPFPGATHPAPVALSTGQAVHGVVMGVHRPLHNDQIWLSVDAIPQFGADGCVRQAFVTFVNITERRRAEQKVQALLDEKTLVLREVHHRIKNNMATVKGLLFLQAQSVEGTPAGSVLHDAESRVHTMMLLYDKLYRSDNFGAMSVRDYLPALVDEIVGSFDRAATVTVKVEVEDFALATTVLQQLGIIVNELLTNIMKYAFVGLVGGEVRVSAKLVGGRAVFVVADNGVGFPEGLDWESSGFGLSLVSFLAKSLHASLRLERGNGSRLILEFSPEP